MIIFENTSADFVLISVENYHNFEQNEDRANERTLDRANSDPLLCYLIS